MVTTVMSDMNLQLNRRKIVGVCIIATMMLTILLIGDNPASAKSSTIKVNIKLTDVGYAENGVYLVYLTVYAKNIIEKTKLVDIGHQICPDDVTAINLESTYCQK